MTQIEPPDPPPGFKELVSRIPPCVPWEIIEPSKMKVFVAIILIAPPPLPPRSSVGLLEPPPPPPEPQSIGSNEEP